jgi:hypothetical protein
MIVLSAATDLKFNDLQKPNQSGNNGTLRDKAAGWSKFRGDEGKAHQEVRDPP